VGLAVTGGVGVTVALAVVVGPASGGGFVLPVHETTTMVPPTIAMTPSATSDAMRVRRVDMAASGGHGRLGSVLGVHHRDRAPSLVDESLAYRAEQHAGDAPAAPRGHRDEARATGELDENPRRVQTVDD